MLGLEEEISAAEPMVGMEEVDTYSRMGNICTLNQCAIGADTRERDANQQGI